MFVTSWPILCYFFSGKLLDGHVEGFSGKLLEGHVDDLCCVFSALLLDGVIDDEAELEILPIFPLLFLLGRDRRGRASVQKIFSVLRYIISSNMSSLATAISERGS